MTVEQPFRSSWVEYRGHHIRARRIDARYGKRWTAVVKGRGEVGRARGKLSALDRAREYVDSVVDATSPDTANAKLVAATICRSGRFETGEGTCALICMGVLGSARQNGCPHAYEVHGDLAHMIVAGLPKETSAT